MTTMNLITLVFLSACAISPAIALQDNRSTDSIKSERFLDSARVRDFRITNNPDQQGAGLTETDRRIGVARSLMRQRNHEAAASMLEVVLDSEPNNGIAQNLLLNCYQELGHALKAEALVRSLLEHDPNNYHFRVTLAEMLAAQNRADEAADAYHRAAELLRDWNDPRLPALLRSQLNSGIMELAPDLIDRARRETGNPALFALERGQLLQQQGRFRQAVEEYFPLLAQDTTREASDAEQRLFEMLTFVGSAEQTEQALLHISTGELNARALRLLSTHFIQSEQFDKAFSFTLQQDSIERGQGQSLLYYIRQCAERRQYAQVCRMAERVVERYDTRSPVLIDALFNYAYALSRIGAPDSAIVMLRQIVNQSLADNDRAEALYRIGMTYAEDLNQCEQALIYFDSVTAT